MDRPKHAGLRHLALNTRNLEAMRRFYVDFLGFTIEWQPDPDNVYLTSGADNIALHRVSEPRTASGQALDHFGLVVRSASDVDSWATYLEDLGATIVAKPKTHRDGARSCYIKDPDGNTIQIIHHPPISGA